MIGVIANPEDHAVAREFFELFKTPWEFYQGGREYDVVLCAGDGEHSAHSAKLLLVYGGQKLPIDSTNNIQTSGSRSMGNRVLAYQGARIPIYGDSITFLESGTSILVDEGSQEHALHQKQLKERTLARIGYDLFHEVRLLLTRGQPAENASIPTLELHIAILRDLIISSGASLVEIPPFPRGYRFIACLTHDVDHPSIRLHKFDHTMFGFLSRAVFGSLINVARGRMSLRSLLANWAAVLRLPFVHLGLAKDCWSTFDRYLPIEGAARSSFFLIPFKDDPGRKDEGTAPNRRAARYGAADVAEQIQTLMSEGCEIGLHGIDAWRDDSKGRAELEELRRVTGMREIGVRMHWLYFDDQSPVTLEQAGADYDSTIGYNETVGYRAGTTQVYKPLGTTRLLELPLHIMDTALFYPSYLDLSPCAARERVSGIIDNAVRFGGCVTVNWHDRSIAPERGWGDFYAALVQELRSRGAWFATAGEVVSWFRKRRSATFENARCESGAVQVNTNTIVVEDLPALDILVHNERESLQHTSVASV